jgi:hypothetical protein
VACGGLFVLGGVVLFSSFPPPLTPNPKYMFCFHPIFSFTAFLS